VYLANDNIANPIATGTRDEIEEEAMEKLSDPFSPRFWEERILPLHTPRRADSPKKGIFVCDMGELFGDWIPRSWQEQVFNAIKANPDYRFYLLTKQPQNLVKFSPFPDNCWVGVTITDGDDDKTPLAYMKKVKAKVKFISFEPLLHWWDVATSEMVAKSLKIAGIDWLIIGAQTRPTVYPRIEWVQEIVEAADKAGIPVFLKDNLKSLFEFNKPYPWATDTLGFLRQEMPEEVSYADS